MVSNPELPYNPLSTECHEDYEGSMDNGDHREYFKAKCPAEYDDHCENHCPVPKDSQQIEEEFEIEEADSQEAILSVTLKCYYCGNVRGEESWHYQRSKD